MVNKHLLTVSKLSQLQKLILSNINKTPKGATFYRLVIWDLSSKYAPRPTNRTLEQNKMYDEVTKSVLGRRFTKTEISHRDKIGINGKLINGKFRASFSRSVKRLVDRGLIKKDRVPIKSSFVSGRWDFPTVLILTDIGKEAISLLEASS